MKLKKTFLGGKMNKDLDERILQEGEYRHAENIAVSQSNGTDVGAVENTLGNEVRTNLVFGNNPKTIGEVANEFTGKIYWFVTSEDKDAIYEYDEESGIVSTVLNDSRNSSSSVLNFDVDHPIQAKILVDTDNGSTFLVWVDGINEPRKINIEHAKSNIPSSNFTEEQICLLRPAPLAPPEIELSITPNQENAIEDRILYFAYQYRYRDNEYSALSPFSEAAFEPKEFSYDYLTTTNKAMVNKYNTATIKFDTGSSDVEAIRIVYKQSGSSTLFLVEEFDKAAENFVDNVTEAFVFTNEKSYTATAIRSEELERLFDAVPRSAENVEIIGNRIVLGNCLENYNLVDSNGDKIAPDITLSYNSTLITDNLPVKSMKSNRGYEVGLVYLDYLGRMSSVITSKNAATFIPNAKAASQNKLSLRINHLPPEWAAHYRVFIKKDREDYDIISPVTFYRDGPYLWIKLEGNDVDKVAKGDFLYAKTSSSGILQEAVEVEVLEVSLKDKNFLEEDTVTTIEQKEGVYMKVKPSSSFTLSPDDVSVFESSCKGFTSKSTTNNIGNASAYYIDNPVYYGEDGLNDLTVSGTFVTSSSDIRYLVEIVDAAASPNTFRWSDDDGVSWSSPVNCAVSATSIGSPDYGVDVAFGATTGHKVGDSWVIPAKSGAELNTLNFQKKAWVPLQAKTTVDESIKQGASITINYKEYIREGDVEIKVQDYSQNFIAGDNYDNIEEWFYKDDIITKLDYPSSIDDVIFRRGTPVIKNGEVESITVDSTKNLYMLFLSSAEWSGSSRVKVIASLEIVELSTDIVFETKPAYNESNIFYEWGQTFPVTGGFHTSDDVADQDQNEGQPAIIEIDAFNCFAWKNGYESYKIKDKLTGRGLRLDTRPWATIPNYRENKRIATLIYSGIYEQTTNLNRLNEFNLATAPYKDLDDKYGPVSNLLSRDTNLVIWQEDKVHYCLFEKSVLFNADGSGNVSQSSEVLGQVVSYAGEYGLLPGDFRAVAFFGNNIWWPDAKRGVVCRLSADGITEISNYGMRDWFRDQLGTEMKGEKIGVYDPHYDQYVLTLKEDTSVPTYEFGCGTVFTKYKVTTPFVYQFVADKFTGEYQVHYNVTEGSINIQYVHNGITRTATGEVSGSGIYSLTKESMDVPNAQVTITPVTSPCSYTITNTCVEGDRLNIIAMVLTDSGDSIGRLTWGTDILTQFNTIRGEGVSSTQGLEVYKTWKGLVGTEPFPPNGENIYITEFAEPSTTVAGTWYGLITNTEYTSADVETIIGLGSIIATGCQFYTGTWKCIGEILYLQASGKNVYIVLDYRDVLEAVNDTASCWQAESVEVNVLANDIYRGTGRVSIVSGPTNGVASVLSNQTIRYINDGTIGNDVITYQLSTLEGSLVDTATLTISVASSASKPVGDPEAEDGTYAGTQVSMSTTGYLGYPTTDGSGACDFALNTTRYHNGATFYPTLGNRVHTGTPLTVANRFNGQGKYYTIPNGRTVKIDTDGRILDVWICTSGGGGNA